MSLSTMAAARQKEIKLSMAVVATMTLGAGWAEPRVAVKEGSVGMFSGRLKKSTRWSFHFTRRFHATKPQKRVLAPDGNARKELRARRKNPCARQNHRNACEGFSSWLPSTEQPPDCPTQTIRHRRPDSDPSTAGRPT